MEYEIITAEDFLKVPADKLADCFADFTTWLEFGRETMPQVEAMRAQGMKVTPKFVWKDDGVRGMTSVEVKFTCPERRDPNRPISTQPGVVE